jgi:hypothetical protein
LAVQEPRFDPARGLMICLGWLRLFRTIVSPSVKRPLPREI